MSDWEPTQARSRAAWKDRYGFREYQDREQSARERREQAIREYRDAQWAGCSCGRVRRIGTSAGELWGGLECRAGKHGIVYLSMAEILTQWRNDSQPSGAGT